MGTERITGTTRLFAVLGDPIAQVQAPTLVNGLFASLGTDAVLIPVHVRAGDLELVVPALQRIANLDGLLVTVPHKAAAARYADELSAAAVLAGSINAMRRAADGRWRGDNFDGAGFVRGLVTAGHEVRGRRVVLVGGGGAGGAIAPALLSAGVAHLTVAEPDPAALDRLRGRLAGHWPDRLTGTAVVPGWEGVDIAVNATPCGLRPDDPLPFDPLDLPAAALVVDIIMHPRETTLLRAAAAAGRPVHPGHPMLTEQLPLYREFFSL